MPGIDFPKMENRKPEIYISLHLIVKLVATDDKRRNVGGQLTPKLRRTKLLKIWFSLRREIRKLELQRKIKKQ